MENKTQSRKWTLVINNPLEAGLTHDAISELLYRCSPAYFCMADEIATTGTPHTHIFLYAPSPVRFSTLKNRFPTAHIEKAYGSASENRAYIRKEGKWAETEKADTVVPDSFMEWGELPAEKEEKAPLMFRLVQCIRSGMSNTEIIDEFPNLAFRIRDIDVLRQTPFGRKLCRGKPSAGCILYLRCQRYRQNQRYLPEARSQIHLPDHQLSGIQRYFF